jgi:hypothetical protein
MALEDEAGVHEGVRRQLPPQDWYWIVDNIAGSFFWMPTLNVLSGGPLVYPGRLLIRTSYNRHRYPSERGE